LDLRSGSGLAARPSRYPGCLHGTRFRFRC
jgi:hypothetical protein